MRASSWSFVPFPIRISARGATAVILIGLGAAAVLYSSSGAELATAAPGAIGVLLVWRCLRACS